MSLQEADILEAKFAEGRMADCLHTIMGGSASGSGDLAAMGVGLQNILEASSDDVLVDFNWPPMAPLEMAKQYTHMLEFHDVRDEASMVPWGGGRRARLGFIPLGVGGFAASGNNRCQGSGRLGRRTHHS